MNSTINDTSNSDRELTTSEAAALLNLSPNTLKKWRSTKEKPNLPWMKRFQKVYYLESAVMAFKKSSIQPNKTKEILI